MPMVFCGNAKYLYFKPEATNSMVVMYLYNQLIPPVLSIWFRGSSTLQLNHWYSDISFKRI